MAPGAPVASTMDATAAATKINCKLNEMRFHRMAETRAAVERFPPKCPVWITFSNSEDNGKSDRPFSHVLCGEVDHIYLDLDVEGRPLVYQVSVDVPALVKLENADAANAATPGIQSSKATLFVPENMLQYAPGCTVWMWNPVLASTSRCRADARDHVYPSKAKQNWQSQWQPAVVMGSHLADGTSELCYSLQVLGRMKQQQQECMMVHGVMGAWLTFRHHNETAMPDHRVQTLLKSNASKAGADLAGKQEGSTQEVTIPKRQEQNPPNVPVNQEDATIVSNNQGEAEDVRRDMEDWDESDKGPHQRPIKTEPVDDMEVIEILDEDPAKEEKGNATQLGETTRKRKTAVMNEKTDRVVAPKLARRKVERVSDAIPRKQIQPKSVLTEKRNSAVVSDLERHNSEPGFSGIPKNWVQPKPLTPSVRSKVRPKDAAPSPATREKIPRMAIAQAQVQSPVRQPEPSPQLKVYPSVTGAAPTTREKIPRKPAALAKLTSTVRREETPERQQHWVAPKVQSPPKTPRPLSQVTFNISFEFGYHLVWEALIGYDGAIAKALSDEHDCRIYFESEKSGAFLEGQNLGKLFDACKAMEARLLQAIPQQLRGYLLATLGWLNASYRQSQGGIINTRDPYAEFISTKVDAYLPTHWVAVQLVVGADLNLLQRYLQTEKQQHPHCRIELVCVPKMKPHVVIVSDNYLDVYFARPDVEKSAIKAGFKRKPLKCEWPCSR